MEIVRILTDESFEQGGNDVERADAVDQMRIEILDLLAVSLVKDLEPISFLNGGLNPPAGGRTQKENEE
jgi:hypothetical protein